MEEDIPKMDVTIPFSLFEYPMMNFGLCNAIQIFQCLMDQVVQGLDFIVICVDDILVASPSPKQRSPLEVALHLPARLWPQGPSL